MVITQHQVVMKEHRIQVVLDNSVKKTEKNWKKVYTGRKIEFKFICITHSN